MMNEYIIDDNARLSARFPQKPLYEVDEVEVWLECYGKSICLFKDSVKFVLAVEGFHVIKHVLRGNAESFKAYELLQMFERNDNRVYDYLLLGGIGYLTFLSPIADSAKLRLDVAKYTFTKPPSVQYSFLIERETFLAWYNELLQYKTNY